MEQENQNTSNVEELDPSTNVNEDVIQLIGAMELKVDFENTV